MLILVATPSSSLSSAANGPDGSERDRIGRSVAELSVPGYLERIMDEQRAFVRIRFLDSSRATLATKSFWVILGARQFRCIFYLDLVHQDCDRPKGASTASTYRGGGALTLQFACSFRPLAAHLLLPLLPSVGLRSTLPRRFRLAIKIAVKLMEAIDRSIARGQGIALLTLERNEILFSRLEGYKLDCRRARISQPFPHNFALLNL